MKGELLGDNLTIEEAAKIMGSHFEQLVMEMRKEEKQRNSKSFKDSSIDKTHLPPTPDNDGVESNGHIKEKADELSD